MRAQLTKNAVIVPAGAKGGFIVKKAQIDKEAIREAYVTYIRSLLDVTDNLVDGEVVRPEACGCATRTTRTWWWAADKGTATFSDTANAISREYGFWLDDAFASRRLGRLRPQEARDHRPRRVGAGQAPLPRAGHRSRARRVHRRRDRRHVGRRVRQRHAAVGQAQAARRLRPPPRLHRPRPGSRGVVRRAQAPVRACPGSSWSDYSILSEGGGVYPRDAKWIELSDRGARAARHRGRTAVGAQRRHPRDPASTGRPAVERRHRHGGQGLDGERRRGARPRERRDPRRRPRPPLPRGRRGRQPRLHAPRAGSSTRPAAGSSTPTSSTTRPASTAPTTRST